MGALGFKPVVAQRFSTIKSFCVSLDECETAWFGKGTGLIRAVFRYLVWFRYLRGFFNIVVAGGSPSDEDPPALTSHEFNDMVVFSAFEGKTAGYNPKIKKPGFRERSENILYGQWIELQITSQWLRVASVEQKAVPHLDVFRPVAVDGVITVGCSRQV